jgi:hypothetical protein
MSKKLMLLAAGALSVLAFTALPSAASAGEPALKCEKSPCTYSVTGGESRFSATNGDTVWCSSVSGNGEMTGLVNSETTTGKVQLLFHGCKEQATIFHFACTSSGQPSGTVTTNQMVTHNVYVNAAKKQGVLLTGSNTTFTCAGGFASTTVTGNAMGELETACGTTGKTLALNFTAASHGQQTWKQITGAGTVYDLEAATNHSSGGTYATAAQTGTGTLTFPGNVTPTC